MKKHLLKIALLSAAALMTASTAFAAEKLKVRQPLAKVEVILAHASPADEQWLAAHADLVCDELNVKQFEICREPDRYITRSVLPDLKKLGPKLGKDLPRARDALTKADAAALLAALTRDGRAEVALAGGGTAVVDKDDVLVRTTAKPGWAAAESPRAVVVIAKELTPELVAEGLVREVVHVIQTERKALDLDFTDRIAIVVATESADLREAIERHRHYIESETLAASIRFGTPPAGAEPHEIDGHPLALAVTKAGATA
jgi:isoleucyl-tRNA synthetase